MENIREKGTIEKIAANTGFLLLGRVTTKIISFFTVMYLVRYLGAEAYGKYAFAFAYISFFTIISDLGLHTILVRETSRKHEIKEKILGNAILISSILSIIAFLLAIVSTDIQNIPLDTKNIISIAGLSLLLGAISPYGVIYEISFKMKYSVLFSLVSRIFLLAAVLTVIYMDIGILWLVFVTVFADAIHSFLMFIFSKKIIKPSFKIDFNLWKRLLKESLPLALSSFFIIIFFRIDVIMLSMMKGDYDVGIYSSAFRLTEAVLFIPSTFMISMYPLLSQYFEKAQQTFVFTYLKALKYLFNSAFLLALFLYLLSEEIILAIYGIDFLESADVFKILSWATAILFINYLFGSLLVSANKQSVTTISTALCAFMNIMINYILIPHYSYVGAAIATVITQALNMAIMFHYITKDVTIDKVYYGMKSSLKMAFIVCTYVYFTSNFLSLHLLVITTILVYVIIAYYIGLVDEYDKKVLAKILNAIKSVK
ncbi:flippase [Methanolobus sp. WCC1]|jgi:O-antigen/teichoic acid export membrane protein|uniref:flippase n=1 Tax=unclassified Methanolobus TaxID=2629569 RepID=UPI00324F9159